MLGCLLAGVTSAGYSSLRHPVSSLALGPLGWIQSVNFVVTGLLLFAFSSGLGRPATRAYTRWGARLLAAAAILLVGAGLFATEPVSGYPPGTPHRPMTFTFHGAVHAACAILGFLVLVASIFLFARAFARRRERGWMLASLACGLVIIAAFFLMVPGIIQKPGWVAVAGLFERVAFVVGLGWVTTLGVRLVRGVDAESAA
jgi:hypothetical membrane protein